MTKLIILILFNFFIQQLNTQIPPVVPLTNALTAVYCHNLNKTGTMTIRCGMNEKIRMLDAFDVVVRNKSHLPLQCLKQKYFSMVHGDISTNTDCKVHTSFTSACSGRENCTLHMQRIRLNSPNQVCHNELVDYTMAFFECISDVFIHDICSSQDITSAWGTLKTPNFPNPYTSNDDCWCKLSTQMEHRLLLSIIIFQLIPYDQNCAGAGLYLESSDEQRSTQCTYLQPGHNYLSDTNSLYMNFYSRTSTVRGGFWIIYEASHSNAEVHIHCGSREKLGLPSEITSISSPTPISSAYNYGWSRLAYNNPTISMNDPLMYKRLMVTTSRSLLDTKFEINPLTTAAAAFTYPYGRLSTFELAYGPRGLFLKYRSDSPDGTLTKLLHRTTTSLPIVKWNSTWRYIRRPWAKLFTTISTTTKTTKTTTTTTTTPTQTTTLDLTTMIRPTSTVALLTTEQKSEFSSLAVTHTSTLQKITIKPRIYDSFYRTQPLTMISQKQKSTMHLPASSFMLKTTLPSATPWYPPAGLFDWWQWQWYTTKILKTPLETSTIDSTVTSSIRTTTTSTVSTTVTTTVTIRSSTTTNLIKLSNMTSRASTTHKNEVTVDWFQWPYTESISSTKTRFDDYDDEYSLWSDYFAATKTKNMITNKPLISVLSEPQRKKYQQLSLYPTTFNWHLNHPDLTITTPTSKRHYTQQNTEGITNTNIQGSVQNQNHDSSEYGWLSKTDMTIVAVSVLFVILLASINLILFAVRRHRRRIQSRHLLCSSIPSSIIDRRSLSNNHLQSGKLGDSTNSLINITNNNNNDILPAVGEIVLWDERDQGGYMIDNHGEWAKIEGRQWLGSNLLKNCNKTSFSKSFRSRFQFIRQSTKKSNSRQQSSPKLQQPQTPKFPLLMDTATLSPVPEADDYQSSELSSSDQIIRNSNKRHPLTMKTIQALIHKEQDHTDEYYKRIETCGEDSNYTTMHDQAQEGYSINNRTLINDINPEDAAVVSVPTFLRQEDEIGTCTDGAESIYNQNDSVRSLIRNTNLSRQMKFPVINNKSIIVGHCQADIQALDPKLLVKSMDKSLLAEHQQLYSCSQSLQLSTYDSGFFDDRTRDNSATRAKNECISTEDIALNHKGENIASNGFFTRNLKKFKSTNMKTYC